MNSLVLLLICIAILVAGYIFYGGWLCKQWGLGEGDPVHFLKLHQTAENVQSRARAENGSDRILPDL
mgnify:CR=1 FL=1